MTPFAETTPFMPAGKAIWILLCCAALGLTSLVGVFLPRKTLVSMSGWIGTDNPIVARVVCGIAAVVGIAGTTAAVFALMGKL